MREADTILVPLAPGFEEIEAVTIVDVLRRAELDVCLAGLAPGSVLGAHGLSLETDCALAEVDQERVAMLVLPGGMPGTTNLMEDERILALVRDLHAAGRPIAAICAAPMVLSAAGILGDLPVTSHPGMQDSLGEARVVPDRRVVRSGKVLTSQGPGTALEFALAIVSDLCGTERADELGRAMVVAAGS